MVPPHEREALILAHLGYARYLAAEIARELPPWVPFEDIAAAAQEGLVRAAERYDPARGTKFRTYAYYRVRGAVFDHIREAMAESPHHRARVAAQAAVDDLVESTLGARPPAASEGAAARDEAAQALAGLLEEAATALSLAEIAAATTPAPVAPEADAAAERAETHGQLRGALARLPASERRLLEGVYFRGLTIEQAGKGIGVTKGWASRLHARGIALLRDMLGDLEGAL